MWYGVNLYYQSHKVLLVNAIYKMFNFLIIISITFYIISIILCIIDYTTKLNSIDFLLSMVNTNSNGVNPPTEPVWH